MKDQNIADIIAEIDKYLDNMYRFKGMKYSRKYTTRMLKAIDKAFDGAKEGNRGKVQHQIRRMDRIYEQMLREAVRTNT